VYFTDSYETPVTGVVAPGNILTGTVCAVPAASRATVLRTATALDGYQVTAADVDPANPLNYWWIDIPMLRIDPSLAASGALISVKIELLDSAGAGICPQCAPICECIYDVAYVCCDPDVMSPCCIYYPYVLQGEPGWASGIAFTNLGFVAGGSWQATLVFTDPAGAKFTAVKTYNAGTVAINMDEFIDVEGWAPAAGAGWLQITGPAGKKIDGYQYNMAITTAFEFGAGVLARPCGSGCLSY